ncbi:MAG TPA: lamin tail domain-containing protein, partial [Patescibacteria group bacterium]|nr:lamin tail domain-containing protein [Patescibacteria group bacterium]
MVRVRRAAAAALVLIVALGSAALGASSALTATVVAIDPQLPAAVPWPTSGAILLAEVVTGGGSASDEYVEITNASAATVDLAGLELVYVTSTGSTVTRKATWSSVRPLAPGQHLLVANAAGTFAAVGDATYAGGFAATGGVLAIRPIGGTPLDAVGWGDAANAFVEGAAAPAPPAGSSLERRPGGSAGNIVDTNDNGADWLVVGSPQPQNLSSPPVPGPGPTPTPPTPASTPVPTSTPTPTAPATPAGTPTPTPMPTATPTSTAPPTAPPTPTPTEAPSPTAMPLTGIADARLLPDGSVVTIEGVVTVGLGSLESGRSGFVQDASGGIATFFDAVATVVVPAGTRVRIGGTIDDRYAQRTLRVDPGAVVDLGPDPLPDPVSVSTGAVGEAIEGLRVGATGTIVEAPTAFADGLGLLLDDGTGEIRAIVMPAALGTAGPIRGDHATVVGVVGQRDSSGTGSAGYRLTVAGTGDLTLERAPTPTPTPTQGPSPTALPSGDPSAAPTIGPSPSGTPIPSAGPTDPPGATPTVSPSRAPSPSGSPVSTVPPIAMARGASIGSTVTVDGFVTVEPGRTGSSALLALGDGSGGIFVRLPSGIAALSRGAHLLVSGTLADPYGQLEVRVALGGIVPATGGPTAPAPAAMGAADLGESTEGRLGTLTGTIDGSPTRTATGLAAWLVDAAGGRARILVAAASGIVGSDLRSGARYRLTGVVGQRASHKGAPDGYRLWLRDRGDVTLVSPPPASPGSSPTPSPGSGTPASVTIARAISLKDRTVSVVGVSTIPATLLDTSGRRIVIQDGTGAIEVRLPAGTRAPSIG